MTHSQNEVPGGFLNVVLVMLEQVISSKVSTSGRATCGRLFARFVFLQVLHFYIWVDSYLL